MKNIYLPDSRADVVAELETPSVEDIAVLAGLAMRVRHPDFEVQHPSEFGDRYIAVYDVAQYGDREQEMYVEASIGLRQIEDSHPVFTVNLQTAGPISSLVGVDLGMVRKLESYKFEPTSSWSRRHGYSCIEASQSFWVKKGAQYQEAPIELPESSRQGKRNLKKLETLLAIDTFTQQKYAHLLFILGEFSIGRARLGKP